MKKKYILFGVILVLLILAVTFIFSNNVLINDKFNVGSVFLDLPNGYHLDSSSIRHTNEYSTVNITNGKNVISIYEYNDDDLSRHIYDYANVKRRENHTLSYSNITINNIDVQKSIDNNNTRIVHYWFLYENKVYDICTWTSDSDFEDNVNLMINSITDSIV